MYGKRTMKRLPLALLACSLIVGYAMSAKAEEAPAKDEPAAVSDPEVIPVPVPSPQGSTVVPVPVSKEATPAAAPAVEEEENEEDLSEHGFQIWLADFKAKARQEGISQKTIDRAFKDVKIEPKVVKLDKKQPDKTVTFAQYKKSVLPQSRIKKARQLYHENKTLLDKIGKQYGVQPRFIVALWAVESNFGERMGGFSIVNALSTLAFEGRRREFFTKELMNSLKIIDAGHISAEDMKGSWAGAMGQSQFMPSTFLNYAVDYDGDGKKDIWGTKADVFASIANYLSKIGWNDDETWGREVKVPKSFDQSQISSKITKPLSTWGRMGVTKTDGRHLPKNAHMEASVVRPDDKGVEIYIVYSNYKVILQWNRSLYFATTVGLLADAIGKG
ncbi:MAG: lytic murein transglycosylase [Rickettsiales bacterium]|nr:lytic murein transglycosylase [Rickettsiales bacterium]